MLIETKEQFDEWCEILQKELNKAIFKEVYLIECINNHNEVLEFKPLIWFIYYFLPEQITMLKKNNFSINK